jgi:hypothetical protein
LIRIGRHFGDLQSRDFQPPVGAVSRRTLMAMFQRRATDASFEESRSEVHRCAYKRDDSPDLAHGAAYTWTEGAKTVAPLPTISAATPGNSSRLAQIATRAAYRRATIAGGKLGPADLVPLCVKGAVSTP